VRIIGLKKKEWIQIPRIDQIPTSKDFNLLDFFKAIRPLVVPRWQREYSWKPDEHVANLLEDLSDFFEQYKERKKYYYLLGQIIVVQNSDDEYEVVDGQQRLTTLYLIFTSLYRSILTDLDRENENELTIFTNLHTILKDDNGRVNLNNEYGFGTAILQNLVDNANDVQQEITGSQKNLIDAFDTINDHIKTNYTSKSQLLAFSKVMIEKIAITKLEINDIPSALDYFEKMNRRGLDLTASDLLKNYLFASVPDERYEKLTEKWKSMQDNLTKVKRNALASTEFFIRSLATSKSGLKMNGTEPLLNYWKKQLSLGVEENAQTQLENIDDFSNEVLDKSKIFAKIANCIHPGSGRDAEEIVNSAWFFKGQQQIPTILAGHSMLNFDYLLNLIDRRFMVYIFAKERTASFENFSANWIKKIIDLPADADPTQILAASQSVSGFKSPNLKETITNHILSLNWEKASQRRKQRFVLSKVSQMFDIKSQKPHWAEPFSRYSKSKAKNSPGMDLEHIFERQDFVDNDIVTKGIYNGIGNLTPIFSSDHSRRDPSAHLPLDKENMYKESTYILTNSLGKLSGNEQSHYAQTIKEIQSESPYALNDWNIKSVTHRSNFIVTHFLENIIDYQDFEENLIANSESV
jgi:uncharacterized protein with ParB-like and HNH nuclease domain